MLYLLQSQVSLGVHVVYIVCVIVLVELKDIVLKKYGEDLAYIFELSLEDLTELLSIHWTEGFVQDKDKCCFCLRKAGSHAVNGHLYTPQLAHPLKFLKSVLWRLFELCFKFINDLLHFIRKHDVAENEFWPIVDTQKSTLNTSKCTSNFPEGSW